MSILFFLLPILNYGDNFRWRIGGSGAVGRWGGSLSERRGDLEVLDFGLFGFEGRIWIIENL